MGYLPCLTQAPSQHALRSLNSQADSPSLIQLCHLPCQFVLSDQISVTVSLLPTLTAAIPDMSALCGAGSAGFKPRVSHLIHV